MFCFKKESANASFRAASGEAITRPVEIRTGPITGRTSRITFSRSHETERGLEKLYHPPDSDLMNDNCPFCSQNMKGSTPMLSKSLEFPDRLTCHQSILFPNLFPYTEWSGVSIFDDRHYVEIGTAPVSCYRDCLINCSQYLHRILHKDRESIYMAITQNHLPAAGGSLVHPHLQVHATRYASNAHRMIEKKAREHRTQHGSKLFSDFSAAEKTNRARYIGSTGTWEWMACFAPKGFYELWAIAGRHSTLTAYQDHELWESLAEGILNTQRFYRSMNRNSYNLGILSVEDGSGDLELKVSIMARSSYAPWVRSDFTGFEMAFDEMATFTTPESTAETARAFWKRS